MKVISWLLIGRVAMEVWLSLFPDEQARRVAIVAAIFYEQQQCHKARIDVQVSEDEVLISAECEEVEL